MTRLYKAAVRPSPSRAALADRRLQALGQVPRAARAADELGELRGLDGPGEHLPWGAGARHYRTAWTLGAPKPFRGVATHRRVRGPAEDDVLAHAAADDEGPLRDVAHRAARRGDVARRRRQLADDRAEQSRLARAQRP
jgi:hypothetical protein